jgi:hypothetical protein
MPKGAFIFYFWSDYYFDDFPLTMFFIKAVIFRFRMALTVFKI